MKVKKIAAVAAATGGMVLAGAGVASAHTGAFADDSVVNAPGAVSGNVIQVPVHIPVDVCGNTVTVIGGMNPILGGCEAPAPAPAC